MTDDLTSLVDSTYTFITDFINEKDRLPSYVDIIRYARSQGTEENPIDIMGGKEIKNRTFAKYRTKLEKIGYRY
jgi:hypothetical protein